MSRCQVPSSVALGTQFAVSVEVCREARPQHVWSQEVPPWRAPQVADRFGNVVVPTAQTRDAVFLQFDEDCHIEVVGRQLDGSAYVFQCHAKPFKFDKGGKHRCICVAHLREQVRCWWPPTSVGVWRPLVSLTRVLQFDAATQSQGGSGSSDAGKKEASLMLLAGPPSRLQVVPTESRAVSKLLACVCVRVSLTSTTSNSTASHHWSKAS